MKVISLTNNQPQLDELEAAYFEKQSYESIVTQLAERANVPKEQMDLWISRLTDKERAYEFAMQKFYREVLSQMPELKEYDQWEVKFDERAVHFT